KPRWQSSPIGITFATFSCIKFATQKQNSTEPVSCMRATPSDLARTRLKHRTSSGDAMPIEKSDLLQGTLDMLILKIVALGPVHGYGISLRIRQISNEVLQVQQ